MKSVVVKVVTNQEAEVRPSEVGSGGTGAMQGADGGGPGLRHRGVEDVGPAGNEGPSVNHIRFALVLG